MAEEMNFGYVGLEEIQKGGNSGSWKWGVNFNVRLKDIEYHEATTNEKGLKVSPKVVMTFGFENEESTKTLTIFEPNPDSCYSKTLKKFVSRGEEGFDEERAQVIYNVRFDSANKTLSNILGCFLEKEKIMAAMQKAQQNCVETKKKFGFAEFARLVISGIKSTNFQTVPLDIMLQYSSRLSDKGNSFLEIPEADKGLFVCKHQEGEWEEEKIPMKHYKLFKLENNVKTNIEHPISRGSNSYFWNTNAEPVNIKKKEDPFDAAVSSAPAATTSAADDINWDI